jgi:ParB-like chromosome segregation protein Spo0J
LSRLQGQHYQVWQHYQDIPAKLKDRPEKRVCGGWIPLASLLDQIERVPVGSLEPYPGNPRRGDVDAIAESLQANRQYAPLIAQKSTRYVLAGNHTLQAAIKLGWETVTVAWVDVDDAHALRILLSANRTADLAGYDDRALAAVLNDLDGDLEGTGYAARELNDLNNLLQRLGDHREEPAAAPAAEDEPAAPSAAEEIRIKVLPEVFDRWRAALDGHPGNGDAMKLDGLMSEIEQAREARER